MKPISTFILASLMITTSGYVFSSRSYVFAETLSTQDSHDTNDTSTEDVEIFVENETNDETILENDSGTVIDTVETIFESPIIDDHTSMEEETDHREQSLEEYKEQLIGDLQGSWTEQGNSLNYPMRYIFSEEPRTMFIITTSSRGLFVTRSQYDITFGLGTLPVITLSLPNQEEAISGHLLLFKDRNLLCITPVDEAGNNFSSCLLGDAIKFGNHQPDVTTYPYNSILLN